MRLPRGVPRRPAIASPIQHSRHTVQPSWSSCSLWSPWCNVTSVRLGRADVSAMPIRVVVRVPAVSASVGVIVKRPGSAYLRFANVLSNCACHFLALPANLLVGSSIGFSPGVLQNLIGRGSIFSPRAMRALASSLATAKSSAQSSTLTLTSWLLSSADSNAFNVSGGVGAVGCDVICTPGV